MRLVRGVSGTALRDWSFGESKASAFCATSERLSLLILLKGFPGLQYVRTWVQQTHRLLFLGAGHGPVIAAVLARPLVKPVESYDCHGPEFCQGWDCRTMTPNRRTGAGRIWRNRDMPG